VPPSGAKETAQTRIEPENRLQREHRMGLAPYVRQVDPSHACRFLFDVRQKVDNAHLTLKRTNRTRWRTRRVFSWMEADVSLRIWSYKFAHH
jgi:hypothetical protein